MKVAGEIFDQILKWSVYVTAVLVAFMFASICIDVGLRAIGLSQAWVSEIAEYILVFLGYMAAAWTLRNEGHVTMDIVVNMMNPKVRSITNTLNSLLGAAMCSLLTWYSIQTIIYQAAQHNTMASKALNLPVAPLLIVLPLGLGMLTIQFLRRGYKNLVVARGMMREERISAEDKAEL